MVIIFNLILNNFSTIFAATLKHVARTVAHVDLADHVIQVVFTLFDENRKCLDSILLQSPKHWMSYVEVGLAY